MGLRPPVTTGSDGAAAARRQPPGLPPKCAPRGRFAVRGRRARVRTRGTMGEEGWPRRQQVRGAWRTARHRSVAAAAAATRSKTVGARGGVDWGPAPPRTRRSAQGPPDRRHNVMSPSPAVSLPPPDGREASGSTSALGTGHRPPPSGSHGEESQSTGGGRVGAEPSRQRGGLPA